MNNFHIIVGPGKKCLCGIYGERSVACSEIIKVLLKVVAWEAGVIACPDAKEMLLVADVIAPLVTDVDRNIFFHTGDLGDVIACLPIIRHLGGGDLILGPHEGGGHPREPLTEARANFIMPLLAIQPYLLSVSFGPRHERVTHDFSPFRAKQGHQPGELLTYWQARHFGIPNDAIDLSPWLTVDRHEETKGMTVIARSPRYHNPKFSWHKILRSVKNPVFIGLREEHEAFSKTVVQKVRHRTVSDALEMARLIAGSEKFIGNQSFPCWLAMAMGHPLVQETWPHSPNSKIPRPNTVFIS